MLSICIAYSVHTVAKLNVATDARSVWVKGAYSSVGVAESSVGARQGAKTSASVDNLTPTQPHLVQYTIQLSLYHV